MVHRWILAVIGILLLAGCTSSAVVSPQPKVMQGHINLASWDFEDQGAVPLVGEWEFYANKLYQPSDFKAELTQSPHWITLPGTWNGTQINGKSLPGTGYATYRLQIQLGSLDELYAIKVPYASTAYRMWINDQLVAENGVVGTRKEETEPQYINRIVYLQGQSDLIIQVSNFEHRRGGLFQPLILGTPHQIVQQTIISSGKHFFLFGSLLIIGMYYLTLFLYRRKAKVNLYFAIICISFAVHNLLNGEVIITKILPDFNWSFALKLEYLLALVSKIIMFPLYFYERYPSFISSRFLKWSLSIGTLYFVTIVFTPPLFFTNFIALGNATDVLVMGFLWYALLQTIRQKREGALITFVFYTLYVFAVFNDILYIMGIIQSEYLMYWGLYLFIFGQGLLLSMNFSKSYQTIEKLSRQLMDWTQNLEEKVDLRTKELEESNQQLAASNSEIQIVNRRILDYEHSRRQLLTSVSHELRTPITLIQGYLEALIDDVIQDPKKKKQHLQQIHGKTLQLNQLIEDLFELSHLEVNQSSFHMKLILLCPWLDSIYSRFSIDVQQAGLEFSYQNHIPQGGSTWHVYLDDQRIDQVFSNLIYNAIKFSSVGSTITLSVDTIIEEETPLDRLPFRLRVKVSDYGTGIAPEDIPYIFERFYKSRKKNKKQGSGLGLAISKAIIEHHGGDINVESVKGEGSTFIFTLPLY